MIGEHLFTAEMPGGFKMEEDNFVFSTLEVREMEDGHVYPVGGRHDCDHSGCPANYPEAPDGDRVPLGNYDPLVREWKRQTGMSAKTAHKATELSRPGRFDE